MPARTIELNDTLRTEYETLFAECRVRPGREDEVSRIIDRILGNRPRYEGVAALTGVPWYVIAALHNMESSLSFAKHLHNGDSLQRRTRRVPRGRPPGTPPFTWELSAADALRFDRLADWRDWSLAGTLYKMELYNGTGYRRFHPNVKTPYLWSFSNKYLKGKYVADGRFDAEAVSAQCGAAVILKELAKRGVIDLDAPAPEPAAPVAIVVGTPEGDPPPYPGRIIRRGDLGPAVRQVQFALISCGCGPLALDGDFGSKTEDAVRTFQARSIDADGNPLEIDGQVGPITWQALFGSNSVQRFTMSAADSELLQEVLRVAKREIGVREKPPGSNRGPRVEEYLRSTGLGGGHPWCAAFVHWCFQEAAAALGTGNPCINTAGVLDHWNRAGREGIRRITFPEARHDPSLVRPGHIFIVDTGPAGGAGHTGLVERVEGGHLVTIEGNTNEGGSREGIGVFRRSRRKINHINKGFIDYGRARG